MLRRVRISTDWVRLFDINGDYFELRGLGYPHPDVVAVFANGATATRLYQRLAWPRLAPELRALPLTALPSTSPAHAGMRFEQKLERWRVVTEVLRGA